MLKPELTAFCICNWSTIFQTVQCSVIEIFLEISLANAGITYDETVSCRVPCSCRSSCFELDAAGMSWVMLSTAWNWLPLSTQMLQLQLNSSQEQFPCILSKVGYVTKTLNSLPILHVGECACEEMPNATFHIVTINSSTLKAYMNKS